MEEFAVAANLAFDLSLAIVAAILAIMAVILALDLSYFFQDDSFKHSVLAATI